jgi:hypothetical protein
MAKIISELRSAMFFPPCLYPPYLFPSCLFHAVESVFHDRRLIRPVRDR